MHLDSGAPEDISVEYVLLVLDIKSNFAGRYRGIRVMAEVVCRVRLAPQGELVVGRSKAESYDDFPAVVQLDVLAGRGDGLNEPAFHLFIAGNSGDGISQRS